MKTREFLTSVMKTAWHLVKTYGLTMSEAMHKAWTVAKLRLAMKIRIVKFYYEKLNGEIRTAWGTLDLNRIPVTTGSERRKNESVMTYYDCEKKEYRCFKIINIIGIA